MSGARRGNARRRIRPAAAHPGQELGEFEEVGDPARPLQLLVQLHAAAGDVHVLPELLAELGDAFERLPQARLAPGHAHVVPHDPAQFAVKLGERLLPLTERSCFGEGRYLLAGAL